MALIPFLLASTKLAIQDFVSTLVYPPPFANGELPVYDNLETSLGDKERTPRSNEPRNTLTITNNTINIFYDPTQDSFNPEKSSIPTPPEQLSVTDTKNVYTEEIVQGLQQRRYGSLLFKIQPKEDFKYRTFFSKAENLENFYTKFFDKVQNVFKERVNNKGELIGPANESSLVFFNLPIKPALSYFVGNDMLMKYREFLMERLKEIQNFPIIPFIVYRFLEGEQPEGQQKPEEKINIESEDATKRFIQADTKIEEIYRWLGIEDLKTKVNSNNKPIELKQGEYNQDYFPAEDILKNTILKQFKHEDLENKTPNGLDVDELLYQVKNLPELIASFLSVFQFRIGLDEYPLPIPESFTNDEPYPEEFEAENNRIEQELQTLPVYDIPTLKELEVRRQQYLLRKEKDLFKFDVKSLAEHLSRVNLQIDEISGQYPIKIKIEENDLIKTDGETVELNFPNHSEAIKELLHLTLEQKAVTEANLNASVRSLIETGNSKVISYRNYHLLDCLLDYFGFGTEKVKKKLPLLHDILSLKKNTDDDKTNDEPITSLLKNSELEVEIEQFKDDREFQEDWNRIVKAAAITTAVHYVSIGKNIYDGFLKDQIKTWKDELDKNKNEFEDFLSDFEDGYSDIANVKDPTKPYGKDKDSRPRVRVVKKNTEGGQNNAS